MGIPKYIKVEYKIEDILNNVEGEVRSIDLTSLHCETYRLFFAEGDTLYLDANYNSIDISIFYALLTVVFLFLKYPEIEDIEVIINFYKEGEKVK